MTDTTDVPTDIREQLRTVEDPDLGEDVLSAGLLVDVAVDGDDVRLDLALGAPTAPTEQALADEVRAAVREAGYTPSIRAVPERRPGAEAAMPGVGAVIAVASGKGGVGKSTVSANLAAGLADRGADVGLFDADVHGPNAPRMAGVEEDLDVRGDDGEEYVVPPESHGVSVLSMGSMLDDDDPVIWRGPVVNNTIEQLLDDVEWGELDYLVVDLPPGTGDVQMTVLQSMPVTGAVVVTTPQAVSTEVTRRGLRSFGEFDTPVLGVVENMRGFVCPSCGDAHDVFGSGGGEDLAGEFDLPYLGSVPLDPAVREGADEGRPVVLDDGEAGEAFRSLSRTVADKVGLLRRHRRTKNAAQVAP